MNDTMIEAMSQFEIPRPILRSSVWPRRTVRCRARARPAPCGQCSFYGYGMQRNGREARATSDRARQRGEKW